MGAGNGDPRSDVGHFADVRVVGAELALLDLERPLEQLELLLRVAKLAVGLPEPHERRGDVRVRRAELLQVDLERALEQFELAPVVA